MILNKERFFSPLRFSVLLANLFQPSNDAPSTDSCEVICHEPLSNLITTKFLLTPLSSLKNVAPPLFTMSSIECMTEPNQDLNPRASDYGVQVLKS